MSGVGDVASQTALAFMPCKCWGVKMKALMSHGKLFRDEVSGMQKHSMVFKGKGDGEYIQIPLKCFVRVLFYSDTELLG